VADRGALPFADRTDAGRRLAAVLPPLDRPLVLGLPRGGVPVAAAVASVLRAELDVFVVRKLGLPWQPELAMGAVATGGVRVLNGDVIREARVSGDVLEEVTERELAELAARERLYRGGRPPADPAGRDVVLVDDGLATGATMRAAAAAVAGRQPARVVAAAPVVPPETRAAFARDGIELVAVVSPQPFVAVGTWYRDFSPVSDGEVVRLLGMGRNSS
jgi:putative phosphoribosyl transferase